MIFGMTFYQLAWLFVIYSFLGWCVEVIYHAVTWGEVTNRGFLNGPVCPQAIQHTGRKSCHSL